MNQIIKTKVKNSMKLTLKQAISKKNEITSELKRHNDRMQIYNCRDDHEFNIHKSHKKIKIGNENLEKLKLLILDANHSNGMYTRIYALRSLTTERSNLEALLRKIPSDELIAEGSTPPLISAEEINKEIAVLNVDINNLKNELDTFNLNTIVEYSPKSEE
jgi:hypothetical protein